jgi:hypothetical protein
VIPDLTDDELAQVLPRLEPRDQAALLRQRARDLAFFTALLFPERVDLAFSPVHRAFLSDPKAPYSERTAQILRADIAPRGSAKSTIKSFADVLHDVAYGLEVCIHIYSTGYRLAEALVKDIYDVLTQKERYPLFHRIYGPIQVSGTQTYFSVTTPATGPLGCGVAAMSFGGDARGYKHAGKRPSKIILDDTVNPKHVRNPEQRELQEHFLQKDILKAGSRYTIFNLVGTIQHPDDLVARRKTSPQWRVRQWQNLIAWPANTALWDECRALWADLNNPDRLDAARAFYEAHRAEMDAGAEVLWPEGRPLFDLMCDFWASPASFWSEDQNTPRDPKASLFDLDRIVRCRWDGRNTIHTKQGPVSLSDCRVALWLDPSKGEKKSDYPALAAVAHKPTRGGGRGYLYAFYVSLLRQQPSAQHEALFGLWERLASHRPRVGYDETGTQGLLSEALQRLRTERKAKGLPYQIDLVPHTLTGDKVARISLLEPDLHNGWLQIDEAAPAEVWDELRDHPHAQHDDGLDAIERATWLACGGGMGELQSGYLR